MTAPAINPIQTQLQKQPISGQPQMPVPGATGMTPAPSPAPQITPASTGASQGGYQPPYARSNWGPASTYFNTPLSVGSSSTSPGQPPAPKPATSPPTMDPTALPAGSGSPPQAGGTDLSGVYNFFKSDLQNQQKQALAGTQADAAARGVYYGTPLTGSEADINTQYLRGLGQLQAGMYGNEQQNQLARLAIGTQLMSIMPQAAQAGIDPGTFQALGQFLLPNPQQPGANAAAPRIGPAGQTANYNQPTGTSYFGPGSA